MSKNPCKSCGLKEECKYDLKRGMKIVRNTKTGSCAVYTKEAYNQLKKAGKI